MILGHTGPHIGKRNDVRMWREHRHKFLTHDGEYGLGDLAYGGCEGMVCGRKNPTTLAERPFDRMDAYWNDLVAHYRSRVERVIHRVKSHAWCQVLSVAPLHFWFNFLRSQS